MVSRCVAVSFVRTSAVASVARGCYSMMAAKMTARQQSRSVRRPDVDLGRETRRKTGVEVAWLRACVRAGPRAYEARVLDDIQTTELRRRRWDEDGWDEATEMMVMVR